MYTLCLAEICTLNDHLLVSSKLSPVTGETTRWLKSSLETHAGIMSLHLFWFCSPD